MKLLSLLTVAALMAGGLLAEDSPKTAPVVVSPEQLGQHIGQTVTLKGVLSQVKKVRGGCVILDFGGRFPNEVCMAFLAPPQSTERDWTSAIGTEVSITGKAQMYHGKPEVRP